MTGGWAVIDFFLYNEKAYLYIHLYILTDLVTTKCVILCQQWLLFLYLMMVCSGLCPWERGDTMSEAWSICQGLAHRFLDEMCSHTMHNFTAALWIYWWKYIYMSNQSLSALVSVSASLMALLNSVWFCLPCKSHWMKASAFQKQTLI